VAYYDGYTIDELKNEIERLNKDFKNLLDAYECLMCKIAIHLNKKDYNMLLKEVLRSEYFNKDDVIDMLIEEREKSEQYRIC